MNVPAQPLARASLHSLGRARGVNVGVVSITRKWSFRHQVEIQKLNELHLDFSAGGTGFEQGGHAQKTVERFKCAGVGRAIEKACDEG